MNNNLKYALLACIVVWSVAVAGWLYMEAYKTSTPDTPVASSINDKDEVEIMSNLLLIAQKLQNDQIELNKQDSLLQESGETMARQRERIDKLETENTNLKNMLNLLPASIEFDPSNGPLANLPVVPGAHWEVDKNASGQVIGYHEIFDDPEASIHLLSNP